MKKDIDEYLHQGIHGPKEINPDERRRFLTTLRERVVIALTKEQVTETHTYPEFETAIQANKEAHLYLNGHLDYADLSKYKKIAAAYGVDFTIVTNKDYDSEFGLVLAHDHAIDRDNIFVEKKPTYANSKPTQKKGFFAKLFNR